MRRLLFFYFLLLQIAIGFSQSMNQTIEEIQIQSKAINDFTETADFRSIQWQDESGQGLKLVFYIKDQLPVKLTVMNVFSLGKEEKKFYFSGRNVIYVTVERTTFQKIPRWEEAKSQELSESERASSVKKVEKNYFYFIGGKLLKWSSENLPLKKCDYKKMEARLIEEASKWVSKLK